MEEVSPPIQHTHSWIFPRPWGPVPIGRETEGQHAIRGGGSLRPNPTHRPLVTSSLAGSLGRLCGPLMRLKRVTFEACIVNTEFFGFIFPISESPTIALYFERYEGTTNATLIRTIRTIRISRKQRLLRPAERKTVKLSSSTPHLQQFPSVALCKALHGCNHHFPAACIREPQTLVDIFMHSRSAAP